MGLWHKYSTVAYLAVLLGVVGHASSEFFAVLTSISGPELSVWRFLLGGAGLIGLSLLFPEPDPDELAIPRHSHHLPGCIVRDGLECLSPKKKSAGLIISSIKQRPLRCEAIALQMTFTP